MSRDNRLFLLVFPAGCAAAFLVSAASSESIDWGASTWSFMRWTVTIAALCPLFVALRVARPTKPRMVISILLAAIVVLFNPFAPVGMSRSWWIAFDLFAVAVFALSVFILDETTDETLDRLSQEERR